MPMETGKYLPFSEPPLVAEQWGGVRTDTNRVGVPDGYDFWYDGFFPYEPRRLRVMPDIGTSIFTRSDSLTIVFYRFVNLGTTPMCIILMSDGSMIQLNMNTAVKTTIMPAGTITIPSQITTDINQWGSTYVLIVSAQLNGYWVWDGTTLYTAGTIGPIVTLSNTGTNYTSQPVIGLVGGSGSGAIFSANISNGHITSVSVINAGSGYLATDTPTLTFTGGTSAGTGGSINAGLGSVTGGSGATFTITMVHQGGFGGFQAFPTLTSGGSGYSSNAKVVVSGGSPYSGKALQITASISAGAIVSITANSNLYTSSVAPTASTTDPGFWTINSTTIIAGGSGYGFPVLSVVDATATIQASPVLTAGVTGAGSSITSVSIVNGGQFKASVTPTVVITDTATTAAGSVTLMPYAVNGNTVETYSGQVWIANGATRYFSAPGSVSDFSTADGGGNATDNDSFLKVGYTKLIQMNGFLWMVADCAINYIGNVTTTGSPPVTNYSKQNADPEVGTIWPNTVTPWGNQLLLANSWGVFLGLGSRMQKISDHLDGIYGTVPSPAITPSVAKAIVFNRKIVCLLLPIVDPVSGAQQNKLLLWDGKKWWSSMQNATLTYIASQEINSNITAYGTDGIDIYPLFTTASSAFTKTLQTKLWDAPGSFLTEKAASRLWGVARYNSTVSPNLVISVDAEAAPTSTYTITGPTVTGNFVFPPQAVGQTGVFTGLTLQTTAADVEIVSLALYDEIAGYRG